MNNPVPFGKTYVGKGYPVYIVFEAGATHEGLKSAIELVDIAAAAGADAIKFQILYAKQLLPNPEVMFTYECLLDKKTGEKEVVTESLQAIFKRRELTFDEWSVVINHCAQKKIEFFATATTKEELDFLAANKVCSVKIASGDINYYHFLRVATQYPWTIQIDTGTAAIGEVERAIDELIKGGCENIIINHCPSGYPAHLDGINLRILPTLQQMFECPIAFSDHTPGSAMDIAAIALGVSMVEKTITLDRTIRSPEHIMSLEPTEAEDFVQTMREVERALGHPRRILGPDERLASIVARRSIVAARDLSAGVILTQTDIDYVRPGDGLRPEFDTFVLGKRLIRDCMRYEKIYLNDVT